MGEAARHAALLRTALQVPGELLTLTTNLSPGLELRVSGQLLGLYSPLLRSLLQTSSPAPTIVLPATSPIAIIALLELLTTGRSQSSLAATAAEVTSLAARLDINIPGLQLAAGEQKPLRVTKIRGLGNEKTTDPTSSTAETVKENEDAKEEVAMEELSESSTETPEPAGTDRQNFRAIPVAETSKVELHEMRKPTAGTEAAGGAGVKQQEERIDKRKVAEPEKILNTPKHTSKKSQNEHFEYHCQKCKFSCKDSFRLKTHYTSHFRTLIQKEYSHMMENNECLECKIVDKKQFRFSSANKLLGHVAIHHKKIDEILEKRGIKAPESVPAMVMCKPEVVEQTISPATAMAAEQGFEREGAGRGEREGAGRGERLGPREDSELLCNYSLECEVCGQTQKSSSQLEMHTCKHFLSDLQTVARLVVFCTANDNTNSPPIANISCQLELSRRC